jgi:SAM-dependent methyltransferase
MEITQIADNLVLQADGIWRSKNQSPISYPEDGNKICFQVEERSFWFIHRNRCILKVIQRFPPSGVLFDIGGGNGFVSLALSSAGVQTVLVEPGERGVAYARNRGVRNIIHSTMEDAGFKEHSLAAVGMFDVLEHIQDDVMFLKMIHALMQPNGRLYLTIPAHQWLWSVVDDDSGHYRRYTNKSLRDVLSRSGFRIELVSYFFLPLVIPIYLFRALPSRLGSRKRGNIEGCQGELAPPSSLVNGFLAYFLGFETSILEKHQIPFGASCVVVAACN